MERQRNCKEILKISSINLQLPVFILSCSIIQTFTFNSSHANPQQNSNRLSEVQTVSLGESFSVKAFVITYAWHFLMCKIIDFSLMKVKSQPLFHRIICTSKMTSFNIIFHWWVINWLLYYINCIIVPFLSMVWIVGFGQMNFTSTSL